MYIIEMSGNDMKLIRRHEISTRDPFKHNVKATIKARLEDSRHTSADAWLEFKGQVAL